MRQSSIDWCEGTGSTIPASAFAGSYEALQQSGFTSAGL